MEGKNRVVNGKEGEKESCGGKALRKREREKRQVGEDGSDGKKPRLDGLPTPQSWQTLPPASCATRVWMSTSILLMPLLGAVILRSLVSGMRAIPKPGGEHHK